MTSSRRNFLKAAAAVTSGLTIGFLLPKASRLAMAQVPPGATFAPNAFLRIGTDDTITVLVSHTELGQGVWTTMPMLIAEELDADWSTIRVEHAPTGVAYYDAFIGLQATGGSLSTRSEFVRQREAGALARTLLVQAAATRFGVEPTACRTENGSVITGNQRARFGELAEAASQLPLPGTVTLKEQKDWKVIGKPTLRLDAPIKVDGRAKYGMDVQFEGLLTAVVARAPVFGGKVKSFDATRAKAVLGVRAVVEVPSGVAVVADHFWAAKLGRDALQIEWDADPKTLVDTPAQYEEFRRLATTEGQIASQKGDVAAALSGAAQIIEAEYAGPYVAHAAMEPLNCTVRLAPDACEIWTGSQWQTTDHEAAVTAAGLTPEQVTLHTMLVGGSFGRRIGAEYIVEAVNVARAAGQSVKTMWTREDDMRGGFYRPSFVHRASVGLGADGLPVAWRHTVVTESALRALPRFAPTAGQLDSSSTDGIVESPYITALAHRVEVHTPVTAVPTTSLRSVGGTVHGFVMESLIDELAHAAKKDPYEYRLGLLGGSPRHARVLTLAAEKAGWGQPLAPGRARGIAVYSVFGGFVSQVAEISVESDGRVNVHRVVCAIDCGIVVNPTAVRAQMEGGIVFALSMTLHGKITLEHGQVQQRNFHDYPVLRMNEAPVIETHIVDSTDPMSGAGEMAVPPLPAAIGNAIFAATGKRLRRLPFQPQDLESQ